MLNPALVRPAPSWRLLLLVALLVAIIAVALVAAHTLLGAPGATQALASIHKDPCSGAPLPC